MLKIFDTDSNYLELKRSEIESAYLGKKMEIDRVKRPDLIDCKDEYVFLNMCEDSLADIQDSTDSVKIFLQTKKQSFSSCDKEIYKQIAANTAILDKLIQSFFSSSKTICGSLHREYQAQRDKLLGRLNVILVSLKEINEKRNLQNVTNQRRRPFFGTASRDSKNKIARESMAAFSQRLDGSRSQRMKADPSLNGLKRNQTIKVKLLKRVILQAFNQNMKNAKLVRSLCQQRVSLLRVRDMYHGWISLLANLSTRRQLRNAVSHFENARLVASQQKVFRAWKLYNSKRRLKRGLGSVASRYSKIMSMWRAFLAWRASRCICARHCDLQHIAAGQWYRKTALTRAFCGWMKQYIYQKKLRSRLYWALDSTSLKSWHSSQSRMILLPQQLGAKGSIRIALKKQRSLLKDSIANSMQSLLKKSTINTVQSAAFGPLSWASIDVYRSLCKAKLFDNVGRIQGVEVRDDDSDVRLARIVSMLFCRRRPIRQDVFQVLSLRSHVSALNLFLAGKTFHYHPLILCQRTKPLRLYSETPAYTCTRLKEAFRATVALASPKPFRNWHKLMPSSFAEKRLKMTSFRTWCYRVRDHRKVHQADSHYRIRCMRNVWKYLVRRTLRIRKLRSLSNSLGEKKLKRRFFDKLKRLKEYWQWKALCGPFSYWSRWKRHASLALKRKNLADEMFRRITLKKALLQWSIVHSRRRLLNRVFGLYEYLSRKNEQRVELSCCYIEDFRLLVRCFRTWVALVKERKRKNNEKENETAAKLFYRFLTLQNFFNAWRNVERWYGKPMWQNVSRNSLH